MLKLKKLNNLGISYKLGLAIGLMGIIMIGLIFYFSQLLTTTRQAFQEVRQTESALEIHAMTVANQMLQCRRAEKNFLLNPDMAHHRTLVQHVDAMSREVLAMEKVAQRANLTEAAETARELLQGADQYKEGFQRIAEAWETMGLDHESGLQGTFRREVHALEKLMKEKLPDLMAALLTIRRHEKDYLLRRTPKYIKKTRKALDDLVAATQARSEDDALNRAVKEQVEKYRVAFDTLVKEDQSIGQIQEGIRRTARDIEPKVEKLAQLSRETAEARLDQVEAQSQRNGRIAIGFGVIAVGLGLGLALLITRKITKLISRIMTLAQDIAQGDLTQKLDIPQTDELGYLSRAMDQMSRDLRAMFLEINQGIQTLTGSATELSAISEQMNGNSAQTSENTRNVAAASEQVAASITQVAAATEQSTTNVQMVASATEEMTATIKEISQATHKSSDITTQAVDTASMVAEKVNRLSSSAQEISKVTDTIADISARTNLLALNATIEAARAGQAGKGFAVVAAEIKDLAEQTANATEDISHRITDVQSVSSECIQAIQDIVGVINTINDNVTGIASAIEQQSATTLEITDNINQTAAGIQEVNTSAVQADQATEEVNRDMGLISEATDEIHQGSGQIKASASELSRLAEELNQMTTRFKL